MKKVFIIIGLSVVVLIARYYLVNWTVIKPLIQKKSHSLGDVIDRFEGVAVHYNGSIGTVVGRNRTSDGYNLGLKYQCVEFVKRFYYEKYAHKMPNSYGHAKDFYNPRIKDGQFNKGRGLLQFSNPGKRFPRVGDLLVYGPTIFNSYGHVAIVSKVNVPKNTIEIVQQNVGTFGSTRETFIITKIGKKWKISNNQIRGWLSLPDNKKRSIRAVVQ